MNLEDLKKFEDNCLKILVKKINGISSFAFKDFKLFGKNYKIMLCGTIHNYCYNNTFCEKPCSNENNCYNLIELIKEYSNRICIDLFTETHLDDRLIHFEYDNLGFNKLSDKNKFEDMITDVFKKNVLRLFINKKDNKVYTAKELQGLSQDEYIKAFKQNCSFKDNFFTEDTLKKIHNYLFKNHTLELKIDEKMKIFKYINYSIEFFLNIFFQNPVPNIRHHAWDIRILYSKTNAYTSPVFFLPELLKSSPKHIDVNKNLNKFQEYAKEIRNLYSPNIISEQNLNYRIKSLLIYLTNYNTKETNELYKNGEEFYNNMYGVFENYYAKEIETIKFNKDENIRIFSELINKQINKSIFSEEEYKNILYEGLAFIVTKTIFASSYSEDRFYYNFEVCLFFSDMYSICRMFKKEFDPEKHKKGGVCDKLNYFKNIVYVGGLLHFDVIYNFITFLIKRGMHKNIQLNKITQKPIQSKNEKFRCIEFDDPIEIF